MALEGQNIRTATPSNLIGQPEVEFRRDDFNALITTKGYNCIIEKAVRCPCEGEGESALPSCQNCFGTGWIFINPIKTDAIASGINLSNQYKDWSLELSGTISLTVRDDDKESLSFYDKVSFADKYSRYSEVLSVRDTGTEVFVFTTYKIKEVYEIFVFDGSEQKLRRLTQEEYSISEDNPYVINLLITNYPTDYNKVVSIRYKHEIQYHVIDLPHELRGSTVVNKEGQRKDIILPMNAVARRVHLIVGAKPNYDGTGWKDNSYL
jgi:hypothetical protein